MIEGEAIGNARAPVVACHVGTIKTQGIQHGDQIAGHPSLGINGMICIVGGGVAVAVAPKIGQNAPPRRSQHWHHRQPAPMVLRKTMQQDERRTGPDFAYGDPGAVVGQNIVTRHLHVISPVGIQGAG